MANYGAFSFLVAPLASVFIAQAGATELIHPECRTEASRMQRITAEVLTTEASAYSGGETLGRKELLALARMATLKARILEAARCPQLQDAILYLAPVAADDRRRVATEFDSSMRAAFDNLDRMKRWQADHPQLPACFVGEGVQPDGDGFVRPPARQRRSV